MTGSLEPTGADGSCSTSPGANDIAAESGSDRDLSDCDREPIHRPGAIQPHGHLIVLSNSGIVVSVSHHTLQGLGAPPQQIIGASLASILDDAAMTLLEPVLAMPNPRGAAPVAVAFRSAALAGDWEAILERHDGLLFVDIEPAMPGLSTEDLAEWLQRAIASLELSGRTLSEVYGWLAHEVRHLTRFDRVMVYNFNRDFDGEVVADHHAKGLHTYFAHHFPAADIPAQARALYLLNRMRIIPNASYRPEPLVPDHRPDTGLPIDLSHSTLRSVSPLHCEYLANMDVAASMSISIVCEGQLSAMIVCHHCSPHFVSHRLRRTCDQLARAVAAHIEALRLRSIMAVTDSIARAYTLIGPGTKRRGPGAVLESLGLPLLEILQSCGAALLTETGLVRIGETPNAAAIKELVTTFEAQGVIRVFTSERIAELYSSERHQVFACGVMALRLLNSNDWLIWFRPEWQHSRIWAGNPKEHAFNRGRINPRRSFAAWQEHIVGRSRPWTEIDIAAAKKFVALVG